MYLFVMTICEFPEVTEMNSNFEPNAMYKIHVDITCVGISFEIDFDTSKGENISISFQNVISFLSILKLYGSNIIIIQTKW